MYAQLRLKHICLCSRASFAKKEKQIPLRLASLYRKASLKLLTKSFKAITHTCGTTSNKFWLYISIFYVVSGIVSLPRTFGKASSASSRFSFFKRGISDDEASFSHVPAHPLQDMCCFAQTYSLARKQSLKNVYRLQRPLYPYSL